jgi:cyclic pyranopterin phosphate synthase
MPVDTLGRRFADLRVSVTDRCNFRCPYCMPREIFGPGYEFLPRSAILSFEEIVRVSRVFGRLGLRKLRLTGGEPTVRAQLPTLVSMLREALPNVDLALTTNGTRLTSLAGPLRDAGLDRVTVSLDSIDPEICRQMNGVDFPMERVLAGIEAAAEAGLAPIKINAVVKRGVNDEGIVDLARHFRGTGHIVRFIEFMDVGTLNSWQRDKVVPSAELVEQVNAVFPIEPLAPNYRGEVAERWRFLDGDGELGFISSVTQPFCGDCNRVRITPQGEVVTCLFATGGTDLKSPLRSGESDDELRDRIASIWRARTDRYSELRASLQAGETRKIEMYQIGG